MEAPPCASLLHDSEYMITAGAVVAAEELVNTRRAARPDSRDAAFLDLGRLESGRGRCGHLQNRKNRGTILQILRVS